MPDEILKSLAPGEPIRLRKGALPHMKIRDWTFLAINKNSIVLLSYEPQRYIQEVKEDDIDWQAYQKAKDQINFDP